jgi:hypothetical protein
MEDKLSIELENWMNWHLESIVWNDALLQLSWSAIKADLRKIKKS